MLIDTSFDFRKDTPFGKDPDERSPTLRRYHKLLWSKDLPNGAHFELDDARPNAYLYHHSALGEFWLASDSVIPTFTRWTKAQRIIELLPPDEIHEFMAIGYTIGGMMIFPGNRIDGKQTINGARGFNHKIADRFDLTLECIRRHYLGEPSPLGDTLDRYREFFALFENFDGYVDFFLLQDLLTEGRSGVKFFMRFDDFKTPAVPQDGETYAEYKRLSIEFIRARNRRIENRAI